MAQRFFLLALSLSAPGLAAAPGEHPITNIFKPLSTPAAAISDLSRFTLIICLAIFLVVAGLAAYTLVRFRHRAADDKQEPPQVYGSNQIELAWTVVPLLIVFVLFMVTARVVGSVQDRAEPANALHITVVGHQWWWEIRYSDLGFTTAGEMHVPVSTPANRHLTFLELESADVIHSFWAPQLAGKTDVIPNRTNGMWLDPHEAGIYWGNCADYCGVQHANMLLRVVVDPPEQFENWVAQQRKTAEDDAGVRVGRETFESLSCVNCHAVRGTSAAGNVGPDLTHLMGRGTLGSGVIANTPSNLRAWIQHPQQFKSGCFMPDMQLTDGQTRAIAGYLMTLK